MIEEDFIIKLGMRRITLVAEGRYDEIVRIAKGFSVEDIEWMLSESEYPHEPAVPPPDHHQYFEYAPLGSERGTVWVADFPPCTAEEERSDLEVQTKIDFSSEPPEVALVAIHVP